MWRTLHAGSISEAQLGDRLLSLHIVHVANTKQLAACIHTLQHGELYL